MYKDTVIYKQIFIYGSGYYLALVQGVYVRLANAVQVQHQ